MQTEKSKFIRYIDSGGSQKHISYNEVNLRSVRHAVAGNFDVVEGYGIPNADGTVEFHADQVPTTEAEAPAPELVVNEAGAENEVVDAEAVEPFIGKGKGQKGKVSD